MIGEIGKYFIFLGHLFTNRESFKTYYRLTLDECIGIGIGSILLVALVATFMGAVTTVQTAFNMVSPLIPNYVISQVVREMTVLELAPTIIAIIYAGKVGTTAGANAVALVRDAEVNGNLLTWPDDITDDEKALGLSQLAALGIIVRN